MSVGSAGLLFQHVAGNKELGYLSPSHPATLPRTAILAIGEKRGLANTFEWPQISVLHL